MLLHTRGLTAWVATNVIASAAFLHFASWTWLEPNLRHEEVARGGDAIIWILSAFPILAVATLSNLVWMLVAARERRKSEGPWPTPATIVVAIIWACALTVNWLRSAGF
jgi:hypothetical protein